MTSVMEALTSVVASNTIQKDTNQRTVLHIFLDDWLEQFEKEELNYRSISTSYESLVFPTVAVNRLIAVATAQRNVAELTEINDALQEEFTWLQEDHNNLHDNVQLMYVQIDNAKQYLKSSAGREETVCFDGQLRIEVVSEIAHFILESLLRSQYNLGYHQEILGHVNQFTPHWRNLLVGRCFQEYGCLLFPSSDLCPYVHNPHISERLHSQKKKKLKKSKSKASRRNLLASTQLDDEDDYDNESDITPLTASKHFVHIRPSLFQVINGDSPAIRKILHEEEDPEGEFVNVRRIFQVNDALFRLLYTKAGPDVKYALTLDELWRTMKRLRVMTQLEQLAGIFKRYAVKPKSKEKGVLHFKLRDWMAFVKDFKLLSPRFTYEAAHDLFRNVQEGASHEDDMEMVYAEFCEAVVALAGFQIPDPFMDWPVKASTFIHRYLNHDVSKE
ncbi:hypothetical protein DYB32_002118 [Aphanomyces invadans]|uniref:Uncharacterized protein n=1 Tax=Aphanomyces invadans TaxID=157072 RepID=A0A3R7D4J3_9STRA|nr:hypothetical protein DYB32_002118 [Aphanomyces invadans]